MKKISKKTLLLIAAAVVISSGVFIYFSAPVYLYNKFLEDQRREAGLTVKSVDIPDYKIVYAKGGTGDTIILLHGFGANKDSWPAFAKFFTGNYHVIIPDMPGFGDSTKIKDSEFSIMFEVEKVYQFVKALKLEKFHLVGHSMGGNIAGNFAGMHPDMVKTLTLIDASRVITPFKSEFDLLLDKGKNPYIVKNVKDFDTFLEFMYYKPPYIPSFVKKHVAEQFMKTSASYEKSFNDGWEKSIFPESKIKKITVPTLIIWGDSDKNFNLSCARIFEKNIKNSRLAIIKECGHAPNMEKPGETAKIFNEFLKDRS
jgi:pimeloyl-ACP methyl ester carboxylesterase